MLFKRLPWEYGIRNLFRRPVRTALTLAGLTTAILLVLVVVGFIRGLENTLAAGSDPRTVLVYSLGMGENIEYSSISAATPELIGASISPIQANHGTKCISPELYLGTQFPSAEGEEAMMGLVRGVTPAAILVHSLMELEEGHWPKSGQVLVGRMAAAKLGLSVSDVSVGHSMQFEGRAWTISGLFSAGGSTYESEVWCRLDDLQQATKRQDLSLVALTLSDADAYADVDLFCKQRLDLELQTIREADYLAAIKGHYWPVRMACWVVVFLVSASGVFVGLNTMYASAMGRVSELAMLQTVGFSRRAILLSLFQEGIVLAATASLIAALAAVVLFNGMTVRFTMGALALRIDSVTLLIGCAMGIGLGIAGSIPPAVRAMRISICSGLKTA